MTTHLLTVAEVVKAFLHKMDYSTPDVDDTNEKLEAAMINEMDTRKIRCHQLEKTLHLAASSTEVRSMPQPVI